MSGTCNMTPALDGINEVLAGFMTGNIAGFLERTGETKIETLFLDSATQFEVTAGLEWIGRSTIRVTVDVQSDQGDADKDPFELLCMTHALVLSPVTGGRGIADAWPRLLGKHGLRYVIELEADRVDDRLSLSLLNCMPPNPAG